MEINSLAGHFLKLQDFVFFQKGGAHVQSSLLPKFAHLFLHVSTMLGLRGVEGRPQLRPVRVLGRRHEAGAVLYRLALRAALVHRRPGPCNARDALGADGCRRWLWQAHWRHNRLSIFPFSRVVLMSATTASVQADSAVPGVLFPRSCSNLCCASCNCITRRSLSQGQACVDRFQHGPWPAGHAGADRARRQDRRRLAGAALARAHSPRHTGERLGHDDHAPAARGQSGRRDEPKQRRTSVDPSLGRGQHPRQWGHPGRHGGRFPTRRTVLHPATKHIVLAALRRGRLPQLQELHPDAGERHSCPLRPRWLLRRLVHEQSMEAPVFGRLCSSRSHGPLRREQGVDNWMASLARRQQRRVPRGRRRGRGTSRPRWALLQAHRARSPLPKTPWNGPWQRRQTTKTTRPCQTRRLSRSWLTWMSTWSAASLCASSTALDHAESQQKCTTIIISHCALCCLTCPLSRVWCLSVVSRVRCLCSVCPAQAPTQ